MQPDAAGPASRAPTWEYAVLGVILAGFLVVCRNEILHGTPLGQDFPFHQAATLRFAEGTSRWFFMDPTSRPLLYALGAMFVRAGGNPAGFYAAAYLFAALACAALALLHDASRRTIASPLVRLAAVALIAFLPASLVTAVVYSADTLALLPFVLAGWALVRLLEAKTVREVLLCATLCGVALCVGNASKATFLVAPVAVALILAVAWRAAWLPRRLVLAAVVPAVALPLAFGLALSAGAKAEEAGSPARHSFDWSGTREMRLSRLLGVAPTDAVIFRAPVLFQTPGHPNPDDRALTTDNAVSYPALLELGMFSDVLNLAGNNTVLGVPRPARQAAASRASVRLGVIELLVAAVATVWAALLTLAGVVRPAHLPGRATVTWVGLGLAWYLPLTLTLPFVHHVYGWGYWLPRLVLPALWAFLLLGFAWFEAVVPAARRPLAFTCLGLLVAAQCAVAVASVWY